ncbi:MAG: tetratricopeptide repeat protein [bacterium]|nr:tetratricopeptide repeat protein [bacterium]
MAIEFLVGLLTDLVPGGYKYLKKKIKPTALQDLFFNAFSRALKAQDKKYQGFLKDFKKKIEKDKDGFLELFKADGNFEDPGEFFNEIKTDRFRRKVAESIVNTYSIEKKFQTVLVSIVKDCLDQYREVFLETIDGEQAAKLIFREHIVIAQALKEIRELLDNRPPEVAGERAHEEKQNQIKILSIMASPEAENGENVYINYEHEQDTMLETFKHFDYEQVFPDMPDPVEGTLEEIKKYLEDGAHHILHITAHGGTNQTGDGILYLEDHRGKVKPVTGAQLAVVLSPPPKIVILSACHSARRSPDLVPAARALFDAAPEVRVVIGMKTAVSHLAAIDFNTAFLTALCEGETVKAAFENGKAAVMTGEARRREEITDWPFHNEHEVPRVLWRENGESLSVTDFTGERIAAPGRPGSHDFLGARYLERGFIGRRGILRTIYRAVEEGVGAVVLKGPGGIGKSTLTTRAAAHLRRKGYDFMVIQGETSVERVLEGLWKKAAAAGIQGAEEVYGAAAGENEKLQWFVENYLKRYPVVIIFDNFESNQDERKEGAFYSDGLKSFLRYFRDSLQFKGSILFISTRYRVPNFDAWDVCEFSDVEFRKMLQGRSLFQEGPRRGGLKRLDGDSIKNLRLEIGGNPRALDLLDRIAGEEFGTRAFTWEELKDLMPELRKRLLHKKSREDDFTPLFLDRLVGYLSKSQRRLLRAVSVYRIPVGAGALSAQGVVMDRSHRRKLEDLSLLEYVRDEDLVYVHRLTARFVLGKMRKDTLKTYHIRAAEYFKGIEDEEGKMYIDDGIESRWHFLEAGEWDRAAEITFDLEDYLTLHGYPQISMELLQELDNNKINDNYKYNIHLELGTLHRMLGKYQDSLIYYKNSINFAKKMNDSRKIASGLHGIGNIFLDQGQYEEALEHYMESKQIFEGINAKKELSGILHQIGTIYQNKGDYDEALEQFQKAKEVFGKIGDIKGVSNSLQGVGIIYQCKGDYAEALKQFQKSMEIAEKIGDIKGVSENLHNIGNIYYFKGDYDEALKQYQKSMEIKEKIGNIVGVALTMAQMGTLYFAQNEFETALKLFIQALATFAKVGSPYANQAKHNISMVREKLPEERFVEILNEFGLKPPPKENSHKEAQKTQKK